MIGHMKIPFISVLIATIIGFCTTSIIKASDDEFDSIFTKNGVEGTIIISSLDGSKEYVLNRERSEKRFLPASTFKILNSLIALDEKVVENENEIIKWDGIDKGWSRWNKDHTLATALPVSCVWFYQELAQRIGNTSYLEHLKKTKYGNKKTGPVLTTFWLNGDLSISAREQIEFLRRLYKKELPYSQENMSIITKLLIVESSPDVTILAKTGWAMRIKNQHGWYVGYVEKKDETWFFATNIDIETKKDAHLRKKITFQALKIKGIL